MSETGGPVYEGVGRPEVAKKGVVEKLKQKSSEMHLSETANKVRERVAARLKQNTGQIVEQKWMDAYQRTVDALDEGKRKDIAKKLKIVAVGAAKVARVGSSVGDFVLRWGGLTDVMVGAGEVIKPEKAIEFAQKGVDELWEKPDIASKLPNSVISKLNRVSEYSPHEMRAEGVIRVGAGLLEGALGKARISAIAAGWLGDVAGSYGEKVAQITNKILRGKPKVGPVTG